MTPFQRRQAERSDFAITDTIVREQLERRIAAADYAARGCTGHNRTYEKRCRPGKKAKKKFLSHKNSPREEGYWCAAGRSNVDHAKMTET